MSYEDKISSIPVKIWREANKQAARSTLRTFKTGAIFFDSKGNIVAKGCSHKRDGKRRLNSVHAEEHALESLREGYSELNLFILSVGRSGNPAFSSCPCYSCAIKLYDNFINEVFYLERDNAQQWNMRVVTPTELIQLAEKSNLRVESFARRMRLK